jgi:hypothetical protein
MMPERDRPAPDDEISVTSEMIQAGFVEAREFPLGGNLRELVESIYRMMEIQRRVSIGQEHICFGE